MLTPELAKYYDELAEMFATAGWKGLVEDAKKEVYQLQAAALDANDWKEVCVLRGRAEQLVVLINYEDVADMQKAAYEEDS